MPVFTLDHSNAFHARAADRLTREAVAWLVTVDADGTPEPSPVWFLWDGADQVLIYSQETRKVRNIEARPRIALHFNDIDGDNVVIFTGTAVADRSHPLAVDHPPYLGKYADDIAGLGMTSASFSADYRVPVVMTIERLRGF